ncbi:MAG: hypothetical protein ABS939_00245 [Psychrobacillus sp.]
MRLETVQGQINARKTEVLKAIKEKGDHVRFDEELGHIYQVALQLPIDPTPVKRILALKNGFLKHLGSLIEDTRLL